MSAPPPHPGGPGLPKRIAPFSTTCRKTKMPRSFPQEILDLIIDCLHDDLKTLKTCCVVSKRWIHRTRYHLFNHLIFPPGRHYVSQWRKTFPDPLNSPSHYTRILSIEFLDRVTTVDVNTLLTFCGVSNLNLYICEEYRQHLSLALLRGFSSTVRSLGLTFDDLQISEVPDLICALPLLEDLSLVCFYDRHLDEAWNKAPLSLPRFTGTLELRLEGGIRFFARQLLDLPNGPHFNEIAVEWSRIDDVELTIDLVSRCSGTLESLEISNFVPCAFPSAIISSRQLTST